LADLCRVGQGPSDQIFRFIDAAAVAYHECFSGVDLGGNNERNDWQIARSSACQRTSAEVANLHVAGSNGRNHFRAAIKTTPVNFLAYGFLVQSVCLGDFAGVDAGLITDREVRRVSVRRNY
jgi:hypothetical protein